MSAAENEPSLQEATAAYFKRLREIAGQESEAAEVLITRALRKIGSKLAEIVPSTQCDVVLFDVGGVLLTNGWDHVERASVIEQFQLDKATFEARHPAPYDALERDAITMTDYLDATVFYEPRPFTEAEFVAAMKAQSIPLADSALSVIEEIAEAGKFLVGVLNNESRLLHEYRMEKYGIGKHLDLQLSSPYVALRKPEPAIYRRALDILGRPGKRVIFIDDRKGNCDAAAAEGIHALQFTGELKLRHDLQQLGIL